MTPPTLSLIISTYNWPEALALVLKSVLRQKVAPTEVLVADDGSGPETKAVIERYRERSPFPVRHIWQEDRGFRLAKSRNNALRAATGEYIVFVDGDTILHPLFIHDHLRAREKNTFVVGSRVLLGGPASKRFLQTGDFHFNWLLSGTKNKLNALYSPCLSRLTATSRREPIEKLIFQVRGCNLAASRADIVAVNGFNEDFQGWGREDSEFALRLLRRGLALKRIKFNLIQYHLFHPENKREKLAENDALLESIRATSSAQCAHGLSDLSSANQR